MQKLPPLFPDFQNHFEGQHWALQPIDVRGKSGRFLKFDCQDRIGPTGGFFTTQILGESRSKAQLVHYADADAAENTEAAGFVGQLFKAFCKYMPPASGVDSPTLRAEGDALTTVFANSISSIDTVKKHLVFWYHSFGHFMDILRTYLLWRHARGIHRSSSPPT